MTIQFFEASHRYKIDGEYVTSVTTALKGIPKEAIPRWTALTVARHALDNISTLASSVDAFGYGPALKMLADVPNEKRDVAGDRGTDVHALAEQYIAGKEIEVPGELMPYVRAYAQYVDGWAPVSLHEELMVGSRKHKYAGRLDSIQELPTRGTTAIVDYKTSNGVYGEYALQCAAYRYAEFFVDADGAEHAMPPVDEVLILHIQPDHYDLVPVVAGEETFRKFLVAKDNYLENVQSGKLKKLIGEPLVRQVA